MSQESHRVRVVVVSTQDLKQTVDEAVSLALHRSQSNSTKSKPEYLTASEVAELMRVRRATVLRDLKSGALTGSRQPGGRWRVHIDDAAAWALGIGQAQHGGEVNEEGES